MHNLLQQSSFWTSGRLSLQIQSVKSILSPDDSARDAPKRGRRQSHHSHKNPRVCLSQLAQAQ